MANTIFSKEVLKENIKSVLETKLDMNRFLHNDDSLVADEGMKIRINNYAATGDVEEVGEGNGNTEMIEARYTGGEYEVKVVQGKSRYTDEEYMRNPVILDTLINGQAEKMVNKSVRDAIAEMGKADKTVVCDFTTATAGYFFGKVVDALAMIGEDEEGYSLLISPNSQAYVRKQLGEDLKYSEGFARTGYIGTVCGVPVYVSKAVPDNTAFLVHPDAITYFTKKGVEVEVDRIADTRENFIYIRKVGLVALTNSDKLVKIAKAGVGG